MRAISFMKTAVLAFAMTALGGIHECMAQTTKTVTYSFSGTTLSSDDMPTGTSIGSVTGFDRSVIYAKVEDKGIINLENFKYYVTNVEWSRYSIIGSTINTYITTYDKDDSNNDKKEGNSTFNISTETTFSDHDFIDATNISHKGIKSFVIDRTGGQMSIKVKSLTVSYYMPVIVINNSSAMREGEIADINTTLNYAGAFTTSDITYTSSNPSVVSIVNGKFQANTAGNATITATLKNDNVAVTSTTLNITVTNDEYGWTQGELYSDYMTDNDNLDYATYKGKSDDGLRTNAGAYRWDNFSSSNGNLSATIMTNDNKNYWRVGVGLFNYFQYLPPYTSVSVSYDFKISGNRTGNVDHWHGVDFIDINSSAWNKSTADHFATPGSNNSTTETTDKSADNKIASLIFAATNDKKVEGSGKTSFELRNTSKTLDLGYKSISHQFALDSYTRTVSGLSLQDKKTKETGSITADNRQAIWKYYAYITYDANGGLSDLMPTGVQEVISDVATSKTIKGITAKDKCIFLGWNTESNGSGTSYAPGDTFDPQDNKCGKGPVTLYAQYAELSLDNVPTSNLYIGNTYKITSSVNNGGTKTYTTTYSVASGSEKYVRVASNGTITVIGSESGSNATASIVVTLCDGTYSCSKNFEVKIEPWATNTTAQKSYYSETDPSITLKVSDLNSNGNYSSIQDEERYTYTDNDAKDEVGKLESTENNGFKVGFETYEIATLPKYTQASIKHQIFINAVNDVNSTFGAEVLYKEDGDYNDCTLSFDENKSDNSVGKVYTTGTSIYSSLISLDGITVTNDASNSKSVNIGLLSFVKANKNPNIQISSFFHKNQGWQNHIYFAHVTFHANNGTDATSTQDITGKEKEEINLNYKSNDSSLDWKKEGYKLVGWSTTEGGEKEYDVEGGFVANEYYKLENGNNAPCGKGPVDLYAVWAETKATITFHYGDQTIKDNSFFDRHCGESDYDITIASDRHSVSLNNVYYGGDRYHEIETAWNNGPSKDGYVFVGWYDQPSTSEDEGQIVYNTDGHWITSASYWTEDGKWQGLKSIDVYPHYRKKFEIDDNTITFFNKTELIEDLQGQQIYDGYSVGSADVEVAINENNNANTNVIDMTTLPKEEVSDPASIMAKVEEGKSNSKISMNTLTYYKGANVNDYANACYYQSGEGENAQYQCDGVGVVVTDRVPMRIPYKIKAQNCTYNRTATCQWGSLCLPFDIVYNSNIKFYKLSTVSKLSDYEASESQGTMTFTEITEYPIPANTPVVYCRTAGAGSIKISEQWQTILKDEDVESNLVNNTAAGWTYYGCRSQFYLIGKDYTGAIPENSTKREADDAYYFKQDKFYVLNRAGKVSVPPYRGYLISNSANSAKSFRLVVMDDEDDCATDITELVDNKDAKGDGKIYDLNGNRVKTPLKGHVYIVDGKKVMY